MKPQVTKDYYFRKEYADLKRFISYFYQIDLIRQIKAKKILFIGIGDGLVSDYLKKFSRAEIVTYDIDPELNPDIVGDVRSLPFKNNEFDLIVAFQILEHIPFEEFPKILSKLYQISNDKVILSLPFRHVSFECIIKFPFIRTIFKKPFLRILLAIPIKFPGFKDTRQHYWEIDIKKFSVKKVRSIIRNYFNILLEKKALLDPYRYFFVLQKKKEFLTNKYVKEYYNKYLKQLSGEYSVNRWFSSKAAQFDYKQTRRALLHAIKNRRFGRVLEVGPGDGTWTEIIAPRVDLIHVIDQSEEMIDRAKKRLASFKNITYEVQDFLKQSVQNERYDAIFSIRCFEYFQDKQAAIKKMYDLLNPNGKLIIVTKNPKYFSMRAKRFKLLHSAQIDWKDMIILLKENGFSVESVYPAIFRWKSKHLIPRIIFDLLHRLLVVSEGRLTFGKLFTYATESYIYAATKK